MPGLPRHDQGMPGLVSLGPSPPQARGPFPRAKELLCDTGQTAASEGRTWGSDSPGGKQDWTKRKKSGISEMSKPSFPFVMIENVK